MDFIEQRRQQAAQKQQADYRRYSELVRQAATAKLKKAEDSELDGLIASLGVTLEQVEADAAVWKRVGELTPQAEQLATATAERDRLNADFAAADEETQRQMQALQAKLDERRPAIGLAQGSVERAERADEQLRKLQADHWRLLGLEDPAIRLRRRHLAQTIFGNPAGATYDVVEFETIMESAAVTNMSIDGLEFVPLSGQTETELAELVRRAKEIITSKRQTFYLLDPDDKRIVAHRNAALVGYAPGGAVSRGKDYIFGGICWDTSCGFTRAPGQSEAELARREKFIRTASAKHLGLRERTAGDTSTADLVPSGADDAPPQQNPWLHPPTN